MDVFKHVLETTQLLQILYVNKMKLAFPLIETIYGSQFQDKWLSKLFEQYISRTMKHSRHSINKLILHSNFRNHVTQFHHFSFHFLNLPERLCYELFVHSSILQTFP